jgi:hypothetical protein
LITSPFQFVHYIGSGTGAGKQPVSNFIQTPLDCERILRLRQKVSRKLEAESFEEEVVNNVFADVAIKTAYFSLAAAAVVFVLMLLLTGIHL